ncbi:hypothetical protein SD960_22255 [Flavobacterium sp. MMLR14_040]|uniref:hypothetical protein n=1 Tax=Flavobacterium sp. MMLR14_040 TaxID=3093843 RepID=UPI00298FA246|nr:hypothetical protein [Flavobacterium sp. MMLR14_040]MDW8852838.1 hypothetical protein [Flavobacterium sp. MMLR14_040]
MFRKFDTFDTFTNFKKDDDLGQYSSYAAYNNDLLRLVDFYGRTPFDWYRNKKTGEIIWLDGHAKIDHYSNLGHSWGKTFTNGDRLLLDGETKKIYYNGDVIYNFKKKKSSFFSGGYALSDGGNNQDPGSLRKGSRGVTWIDFGGAFEALIIILGFEVKGTTSRGKGTNGGKPTYENKVDDGINAVDFGSNGIKAVKETVEKQQAKENNENSTRANKNLRTTWYNKDGKEIRTEIKKDYE